MLLGLGVAAVPIRPYLGDGVFDPDAIAAIVGAFEDILAELQLVDRQDPLVDIVAGQVMKFAQEGQLDRGTLRDLVLTSLRT